MALTSESLTDKYVRVLFLREFIMASRTKKTESVRKRKAKTSGSKRKAADRNKGTTPKFAVHQ